jgi:hypothetical protein
MRYPDYDGATALQHKCYLRNGYITIRAGWICSIPPAFKPAIEQLGYPVEHAQTCHVVPAWTSGLCR